MGETGLLGYLETLGAGSLSLLCELGHLVERLAQTTARTAEHGVLVTRMHLCFFRQGLGLVQGFALHARIGKCSDHLIDLS